MSIFLGTDKVKDIYLGTQKISKVYLGNDLVYQSTKWRKINSSPFEVIDWNGELDNNFCFRVRVAIPGFSASLTGKAVQVKAQIVCVSEGNEEVGASINPNLGSATVSNLPWAVDDQIGFWAGTTFTLFKPTGNYIEGEGSYAPVHGGYGQWFKVSEVWVYE